MNLIEPKKIIIIRCSKDKIEDYRKKLLSLKIMNYSSYFIDNEETDIPKELSLKKPIDSFTAYICEGFKCLPPINSFEELLKEFL